MARGPPDSRLYDRYAITFDTRRLPMELTAQEAWSRILEGARGKIPEHTYRTWLAPTEALALSTDLLVVGAPSDFAVEWIEDKYGGLLVSVARGLFGSSFSLAFERQGPGGSSESGFGTVRAADLDELPNGQGSEPELGAASGAPKIGSLNPRYTLDRFVVGGNNELCFAACQAVADAPGTSYNPLFIYGGVGLGKTHLMHAIGNAVLAKYPRRRVGYVPTEQFTNELIAAIQARRTSEFHNRYRRIDVLLVDDAHFLAGKEGTQEEFFHTFNTLHDSQKQIVLTSDRPPKEIPGLQERLVSRFEWGLVTDIRAPDLETRIAILQLKAAEDQLAIRHDVLALIAEHCTSSVRELEGAVIKLLAYSSLTQREITPELASEVLQGAGGALRQLTPERIEAAVASVYDVTLADMRSSSRRRRVTEPRQVAMYLQKSLLELPYTQIGYRFGGRDHSTVIHSIQKIADALDSDAQLQAKLAEVQAKLS